MGRRQPGTSIGGPDEMSLPTSTPPPHTLAISQGPARGVGAARAGAAEEVPQRGAGGVGCARGLSFSILRSGGCRRSMHGAVSNSQRRPHYNPNQPTRPTAKRPSGLTAKDISSVEIVGSATRVPAVYRVVEEVRCSFSLSLCCQGWGWSSVDSSSCLKPCLCLPTCAYKNASQPTPTDPNQIRLAPQVFGQAPSRTLNAKEVVSRGCALQCAMLSPTFKVRC
jgi:hypothetical protein